MSTLAEITRYYCGRTEPVERNTDTTSRRRIVHQVSLRSVKLAAGAGAERINGRPCCNFARNVEGMHHLGGAGGAF